MRTTDADVKAIITTQLDTVPFILTASLLVDTYLASANLSNTLLREIEKYWAAHLVRLREPQVIHKEIDETVVKYATPKAAEGLASTGYGQTVLDLTGGLLAQTTTAQRALLRVD